MRGFEEVSSIFSVGIKTRIWCFRNVLPEAQCIHSRCGCSCAQQIQKSGQLYAPFVSLRGDLDAVVKKEIAASDRTRTLVFKAVVRNCSD